MFLHLVTLVAILSSVTSYKNGAPLKACLKMTPKHGSIKPKPLTSALHKVEFAAAPSLGKKDTSSSKEASTSNDLYVVTIMAVGKSSFKGFFLQARSTIPGEVNPVGYWDVSGATVIAKGVNCGNKENSAVTHVDNTEKPSVTLIWRRPKDFKGKVVFVATVVQDFKNFWVGIQSDSLQLESVSAERVLANPGGTGSQGSTEFLGIGNSSVMTSSVPPDVTMSAKNFSAPVSSRGISKTETPSVLQNSEKIPLAHPLGSANNMTQTNSTSSETTNQSCQINVDTSVKVFGLFAILNYSIFVH